MSIRGIFVESIIRHIAGCLLVALVFPYILLKCVIMVCVIIDSPPNFEGKPRMGDVLYEMSEELTGCIKSIYGLCLKK